MRRQAIIGVVALVAASSALTGVAAAEEPAKPQANSSAGNSFEGTCRLTGGFNLTTPLGGLPRPTTFTGIGTGTCTGSLNGGPSKDHPTLNQISGIGTLSCFGGHTLTDDVLVFDSGRNRRKIRVFTDTAFAGVEAVGHFMGAISGDGVVEVNVLPYFDQSTMAQCQAGTLTKARYDLTARTITPLVG